MSKLVFTEEAKNTELGVGAHLSVYANDIEAGDHGILSITIQIFGNGIEEASEIKIRSTNFSNFGEATVEVVQQSAFALCVISVVGASVWKALQDCLKSEQAIDSTATKSEIWARGLKCLAQKNGLSATAGLGGVLSACSYLKP